MPRSPWNLFATQSWLAFVTVTKGGLLDTAHKRQTQCMDFWIIQRRVNNSGCTNGHVIEQREVPSPWPYLALPWICLIWFFKNFLAGEAAWTWQVAWRSRTDSREQESSCERRVGRVHGARLTSSLWDCTVNSEAWDWHRVQNVCPSMCECIWVSGYTRECMCDCVCLSLCVWAGTDVSIPTYECVGTCVCACMRVFVSLGMSNVCVGCEVVHMWKCICMRVCGGGRVTRESLYAECVSLSFVCMACACVAMRTWVCVCVSIWLCARVFWGLLCMRVCIHVWVGRSMRECVELLVWMCVCVCVCVCGACVHTTVWEVWWNPPRRDTSPKLPGTRPPPHAQPVSRRMSRWTARGKPCARQTPGAPRGCPLLWCLGDPQGLRSQCDRITALSYVTGRPSPRSTSSACSVGLQAPPAPAQAQ